MPRKLILEFPKVFTERPFIFPARDKITEKRVLLNWKNSYEVLVSFFEQYGKYFSNK